jgi:hypothetical protein
VALKDLVTSLGLAFITASGGKEYKKMEKGKWKLETRNAKLEIRVAEHEIGKSEWELEISGSGR